MDEEECKLFSGKFYNAQDCIVEPKPVQKPYPPLSFGGWSNNRILRRAGGGEITGGLQQIRFGD
jgi:alkanesulfonate monooxygenase SsuD/methylene tetrahydromethanopterin reductase-like flavin-dependent oxidoreductase (luciferase family)